MRLIAGAVLILAAAVCLAGALVADALCVASNRLNSPAVWGYLACLAAGVAGLVLLAAGTLEALDAPPGRRADRPAEPPCGGNVEERHQA
jgi:hypothetical protein